MKIRLSLLSLCATFLLASILISSCTQTNTPPVPDNRSKVISSSTDIWIDVTGLSDSLYEFTVTGNSSLTVLTGFSSYQNGTIRVFWNRGSGDTGADTVFYRTTTSTTASAGYYVWAPAIRPTGSNPDGSFRLFETSAPASVGPSGLILSGATTRTAAISSPDSTNVDLILETYPQSGALPFLSLDAADVLIGTSTHKTIFADHDFLVTGGLANQHNSTDVSGTFSLQANTTTDFTGNNGESLVLVVRTSDNHYARVEIEPQPNGFLWGDTNAGSPTSKRYIDVFVVYQPTAAWGYVGRPPAFSKGLAKRVSVGSTIHQ